MSMPRSVPAMLKRPSSKVMSATAASSASEAACLPFSITLSAVTQDRLALRVEAARAAGAAADGDGVGVALADADLVAVDAEPVGGELDIGGLVALAGGLGADIDVDEAVIGEADLRAFGRVAAGGLEVVGQADAALACPARSRCGAAGRRSRPSPSSASAASSTRWKSPLS